MKTKTICDIFGIRFQDTFYDLICVDNPRLQYKEIKDILSKHGEAFSARDSDLSIAQKDIHGIVTFTIFTNGSSPESYRGQTFRNCYIDKNHSNFKKAICNIGPACKNIIETD